MQHARTALPISGDSSAVKDAPALVLITTSYPIQGDGREAAGSFVADLAEELATEIPIRVVAPGRRAQREVLSARLEVFRYLAPDVALSTLKPWSPLHLVEILRTLRSGQSATLQAALHGETSHLLALWALPSGHWARSVSQRLGIPYSVWTLGSDIWTLGRIPLVRAQLRRVLRDAKHCYSDGLKLAEDTRRLGGREVEFLPSTRRITRQRTQPLRTAPPYRLLFLGRWHPNKGVDILIESLHRLSDDDWNRIEQVVIAGGGSLERLVREQADALRARGRPVSVTGYLGSDEAQRAILAADYLLLPSRIESIPVIFSDAMKLDTPVVATPVGDLPTLVIQAPECGVLSAAASPGAFVGAIREALGTSPARFASGMAQMRVRFDLSTCARLLVERTQERVHHVR